MADQVDNDLKERLNSFIADILSGRGSNPAKFNELQNELERVSLMKNVLDGTREH